MIISIATVKEEPHVFVFDKRHLTREQLSKAISDNRVYVAKTDDIVLGYARFGLFWDSIPFLNMLYVPDGYKRMGVGSYLLKHWENDMREKGHAMVLTSSMTNEKGQHFFRKHGYMDIGNIFFEDEGLELILSKRL